MRYLLDHLVGEGEQFVGDCKPERPGGLAVDNELEFGGLQDRKVCGLGALKDAPDISFHSKVLSCNVQNADE